MLCGVTCVLRQIGCRGDDVVFAMSSMDGSVRMDDLTPASVKAGLLFESFWRLCCSCERRVERVWRGEAWTRGQSGQPLDAFAQP